MYLLTRCVQTLYSFNTVIRPQGLGVARVKYMDVDILQDLQPRDIVYDQGPTNTCVTNALCFALKYCAVRFGGKKPNVLNKSNKNLLNPSRLYIYYNARMISGQLNDTLDPRGSQITLESALLALDRYGVCPEQKTERKAEDIINNKQQFKNASWLRDNSTAPIMRFNMCFDTKSINMKPSDLNYLAATSTIPELTGYAELCRRVRFVHLGVDATTFTNIKTFYDTLTTKRPILIGLKVASLDTVVKMPLPGSVLYGHAMVIVGYVTYLGGQYFKVLNSWSEDFGDKGFCYISEEYVQKYTLSAYAIWLE